MKKIFTDIYFMQKALEEAKMAFEKNEIPVGAVVVMGDKMIAKAHNLTEKLQDATAHAEMIAITSASNYLQSKYLKDAKIYVTLAPCLMCSGALHLSQVKKIIYGAKDAKNDFNEKNLHPKTEIIGGVLENECSELLKDFFKGKRT